MAVDTTEIAMIKLYNINFQLALKQIFFSFQVYVLVGGSWTLSDTEVLKVGEAAWTTLPYQLPVQISGMASVSLNNKIFILGNFSNQ